MQCKSEIANQRSSQDNNAIIQCSQNVLKSCWPCKALSSLSVARLFCQGIVCIWFGIALMLSFWKVGYLYKNKHLNIPHQKYSKASRRSNTEIIQRNYLYGSFSVVQWKELWFCKSIFPGYHDIIFRLKILIISSRK